MRTGRLTAAYLAGGVVLLVLTLWLLAHNLTVEVSASDVDDDGPAGVVGCVVAPYDAGLFGNDEPPGGEHSRSFSEEVAADCYAANMWRFKTAVGTGVAALLLVLAGAWSSRRSTAVPPRGMTALR